MAATEELGLEVFVEGWKKFEDILDKLDKKVGTTGESMTKTGGIAGGAFAVALGNVAAKAVETLIRGLVKAGEAVIAFGVDSVKMAADFQSQMAILEIAASSTGLSFDQLHDAALAVGGDISLLGVSATGAADSMTGLFKAGLTNVEVFGDLEGYMAGTAELGGALRASIDLAAASELDMVQASDLAAIALAAFGGELETETERAEFINEAMNNMVMAADASVAEVSGLAEALKMVGPTASAAGLSIQDTNNALAILSTRGIQGSMAGTALDGMLRSLRDPTEQAAGEFKKLGIEIFDLASGEMLPLVDIIGQFEGALGDATDAERALALGTIFTAQGQRAMNTLLSEGAEGWTDMEEATASAAGIQEVAAARGATFNAQMEALEGTIETLKIGIGEQFLPIAQELATWFAGMVDEHGPALQAIFEAVAVAVGNFWEMLGFLSQYIAAVLEDGDELNDWLTHLPEPIQSLVLFIQNDFLPAWREVWTFVMEQVEKVVAWFQENLPIIKETILSVVTAIRDWFITNWPIIQAVFVTAWTVMRDIALAVVSVFVDQIWPSLQSAFSSIEEGMASLGIEWSDIWEAIKTAVAIVASAIGAILLTLIGVITGIFAGIAAMLENLAGAWENWAEAVKMIVEGFAAWVTNAWMAIRAFLEGDTEAAMGFIRAAYQGMFQTVQGIVQAMLASFQLTFGSILAFIEGWVEGVLGFFQGLYDRLVGGSLIPELLSAMKQVFTIGLDEIVGVVRTKIEAVLTTISGFVGRFRSMGSDLIDALKSGIVSAASALARAAAQAVRDAIQAAKDALDWGSPSKVFVELGRSTMEGMALGVAQLAPVVQQQITAAITPVARPGGVIEGAHTEITDNRQFNLNTTTTMRPGGLAMEFARFEMASR